MSRRKAREIVLCLVFEKDYHNDISCEKLYDDLFENCDLTEVFDYFGDNIINAISVEAKTQTLNRPDEEYIKTAFFGIFDNIEEIDNIISNSIIGWQYNRISKVSMALLRIAVYEILYIEDITVPVAINEAVELSKRYDYSEAYTFVNGVLGAVVKNI